MYEEFTLKTTDKGKIAGYSWPLPDPDKVVCIIHGIGEYGGRFDRVASRFAETNIAALSMDLRGHGNSINPKGHCAPREDVLDDICDLLLFAHRKYPKKGIVLYGHSMGGNITLDYRCRGAFNDLPEKYIISAPWIRLVRPVPAIVYRITKAAGRIMPELTIGSSVDESILGHPDCVKPYNSNPMVHNRISLQCAVEAFEAGRALEEGTLVSNGRSSDIPTLLMHGTADKICSIEGTAKVYENMKNRGEAVEFIRWPGLFHEIHNGNIDSRGDEVIEKMIRFTLGQTD